MNHITEHIKEETAIISAGNAINTISILQAQIIADSENIINLKSKIKTDIQKDVFNEIDFLSFTDATTRTKRGKNKLTVYKTELNTLKSKIANLDYKNDIQIVINTL